MEHPLLGTTTRLRSYRDTDFPAYWELLHDEAVFPNMGAVAQDKQKARQTMLAIAEGKSNLVCTIETKDKAAFVGITSLLDITPEHRRAKIAMTMIAPQYRRQGHARDARVALYRHAFETLGLQTLYGFVFTDNERNKKHLENIGFRAVATIPKWGMRNGKDSLQDEFFMLASKEDFFAAVGNR